MVTIHSSFTSHSQRKFSLDALSHYFGRKALSVSETWKWQKRLRKAKISHVGKIFTYTTLHELRAIYELVAGCPRNSAALEIGSHLGASSCYIAAALASIQGHLFCVDTWNNETMPEGKQETFAAFQHNVSSVRHLVTPIRKLSKDLEYCDFQTSLSFVFIDGDHSYAAVKEDFERVKQWLTPTGVIAFHDFGIPEFEGVSRVVGEALASGQWIMGGKVDSLTWITPAQWRLCPWLKESNHESSC